jgi:hypothetical protein
MHTVSHQIIIVEIHLALCTLQQEIRWPCLATSGAAPLAVSNAATGAGTGAALLNSVGGLFVLLAFLFGW